MNNKMVAHEFNAQHKESASGSNFRFEGKLCYSYSTPIAYIEPFANYVMISSKNYSVTTSKHQAYLRNACSNRNLIFCPLIHSDVNFYAKDNASYFLKEIQEGIQAYNNCQWKNKQIKHRLVIGTHNQFKEYINLVSFNGRAEIIRTIDGLLVAHNMQYETDKTKIEAKAEENRILEEKRKEALRLAQIEHEKLAIPAWISGKDKYTAPNGVEMHCITNSFGKTYCRLINNDTIETSRGARVSLDKALLFYRAIKAGRDVNGMQIDSFTVVSHVDGVVKIGCHVLEIAELDRCFATIPAELTK